MCVVDSDSNNSVIHTEDIIAFPLQHWLGERATVLHFLYCSTFLLIAGINRSVLWHAAGCKIQASIRRLFYFPKPPHQLKHSAHHAFKIFLTSILKISQHNAYCNLNQHPLLPAIFITFNPLASNDVYVSRTTHLTSRRCILNIYSTNILTEYFKHAAHSPFFSLQGAFYFIVLSFLVPVIFTF